MLYVDPEEFQTNFADGLTALVVALLRGEAVLSPRAMAAWTPEDGLAYWLAEDHPDGPTRRETGAAGVYEAAEQVWHLMLVESDRIDVRCRACGYLDPAQEVGGYDKPDDFQIRCMRCNQTDNLGSMRGIEPAPGPNRRARLQLMEATLG